MKQHKKRIFGILLSFALMLTMMPILGLSQTAYAGDWATWDENQSFNDDGNFPDGVVLNDNITITIAEGKTVRVEKGIYAWGKTLTVEGKGNLIVNGSGGGGSAFTGNIIVNGGEVTLTGGTGGEGENDYGGNGIIDGNVVVSGGSFSATGGNGYGNSNRVGQAVSYTITCENGIVAQESADGSEWSGISGTSSNKQYVRTIQTYPLWVGGTQVNSANADDILGDQTASYVAESNTLTLNNAIITKGHKVDYGEPGEGEFGIYYNGSKLLNIDLAEGSVNTVKIEGTREIEMGIYVDDQYKQHSSGLNISGKGKLTVSGTNYGIHAPYITIDECDVTASGGRGIHSYWESIEIKGGSVYASATSYAIEAYSDLIINAGSKVTASGDNQAIKCDDGYVKNAIAGTGWTNKEGDEGETPIPISTEGQTLTFKKVQFPAAHTHNFTYTASGDTITATCSAEGCPLPPSTTGGSDHVAKLTIAAPEHTTYGDGESAEATITDEHSIKGEAAVVYKKGTETLTSAPTDAGTYTASITVGGATASVEYTIAKANPTANAPSGLTTTYGKTLADVTLTNPSGNTEGTWAWVEAGTTSVGNVGTQTHKANFTPTDNANYNSVSNVDVSVTVNKAANPATVSSTASVKKGGNTVELADNVTKNGATGGVTYSFANEEQKKGCSLSGSELTSGNETGEVVVNVNIAEDNNYEASETKTITVTITEKDAQTITADDVTATYGDADKKVSATTTGDGSISYAVKEGSTDYIEVNGTTGELTIIKVPADGKADVTVTAAETKTYAPATRDVTVNINKKSVTVKANDKSIKVGEAVPDLSKPALDTDYTVSGLVGTDKLKADPKLAYASQPDNTKVGSYAIEASNADAGDNYAISYEKGTLTISEKPAPTPTPTPSAGLVVTTTAKTSARSMTVKWTWNDVAGAKSYKVSYHKVGSKKWTTKTTKKTKFVVKGHKMKGLYEYKVGAVSKAGTTWSGTSRRYFSEVKAKAKAAKGAIKVSWKKDKSATGYQVLVATNKNMNNSKVFNVSSSAKTYKVKGLMKGKRYYVKVRPMKKAGGVTYKGILSKTHKVKVK